MLNNIPKNIVRVFTFVGIYITCNSQRDTVSYDINTDIYISFPDC